MLSLVQLCDSMNCIACQPPLSMEYWSGLPYPSPDLWSSVWSCDFLGQWNVSKTGPCNFRANRSFKYNNVWKNVHHDEEGFMSIMQCWFNFQKSVKVIHPMNRPITWKEKINNYINRCRKSIGQHLTAIHVTNA